MAKNNSTLKALLVLAIMVGVSIGTQNVFAQKARPSDDEVRARTAEIAQKKADEAAYRARASQDTPEERKARKELEEELKRQERGEDKSSKALRNSGLTGCIVPTEVNRVWIDPRATGRPLGFVHSALTILNNTGGPIPVVKQIDGSAGRLVVKDLCQGGSLTLIQRIGYYDQVTVAYMATWYDANGQAKTAISPPISLYPCQGYYCREEYSAVWDIR